MTTSNYGESHPRPQDDRLPVMLVILDGLGDRPITELGDRTPAEAAQTPVLDRLTRRGASGWHLPFGWGPAPSSEVAHWAMFGYTGVPFPGRAVLEALGAGLDLLPTATLFVALRTSEPRERQLWITGRAGPDDGPDAAALLAGLTPVLTHYGATLHDLNRGEAILQFACFPNAHVTDSDPFFENLHPWLRVRPSGAAAAGLAARANDFLLAAREHLMASATNRARTARNKPALDVLTTKWAGTRQPVPSFTEQAGVRGAAVTSARMYRGMATLLGMAWRDGTPQPNLADDIAGRIATGMDLIGSGARFVHVHTKATDEAGHTKDPRAKLRVLEALDPGLAVLERIAEHAVVAITGDHATPSVNGVMHTADPTPLLILGPTIRPDGVRAFGESYARQGWFGPVRAAELLPLLFSHANRPVFLGHRATPNQTLALPDHPEAMTIGPPITVV